jgi:hypothetical protein
MVGHLSGDGNETKPISPWSFKEYLPLLVTSFSLLFIGLRLLSISNYNFETAYGILQASGTGTVIIGALIPAIGFIIPTMAAWLSLMLSTGGIDQPSKPLAITILALLFTASVFVTPVYALVAVSIMILFAGLWLLPSGQRQEIARRPPSEHRKKIALYTLLAYIVIIFITTAVTPIPWLPSETVVLHNTRPFTGYIVGETGTDATVLISSSRQIIHVDSHTIISRTVCTEPEAYIRGFFFDTLPMLMTRHDASYPTCPRL